MTANIIFENDTYLATSTIIHACRTTPPMTIPIGVNCNVISTILNNISQMPLKIINTPHVKPPCRLFVLTSLLVCLYLSQLTEGFVHHAPRFSKRCFAPKERAPRSSLHMNLPGQVSKKVIVTGAGVSVILCHFCPFYLSFDRRSRPYSMTHTFTRFFFG